MQVPSRLALPVLAASLISVTSGQYSGSRYYGQHGSSSRAGYSGPFPDSGSQLNSYQQASTPAGGGVFSGHDHVCSGFDEQFADCPGLPPCSSCVPINCRFDEWGMWFDAGGCSGIRFRQRGVKVSNNECGRPCSGPKIESQEHRSARCVEGHRDCEWGEWSEWTHCSSPVDQATRSRSIAQMNTKGGKACNGPTKQTRACGKGHPPVDCSFSAWNSWTTCSATCGEGRHTRIRRISQEAKFGGKSCYGETHEAFKCMLRPCQASGCVLSEWSEWSSREERTGGSYSSGGTSSGVGRYSGRHCKQEFRTRRVVTPPGPGGSPCDEGLEETRGCERPQAQDCIVSEWTLWSRCDKTCEGGQRLRHRKLQEPSKLGGSCRHYTLLEVEPCNTGPCQSSRRADCQLSFWSEWSECSARCGEGSSKRSRRVVSQASAGGAACEGSLSEMKMCKSAGCHVVDCRWAEWSPWSDCSCDCGGGTKRRSRAVAEAPRNGGRICVPQAMEEAFPCNTQPCGVGCVDGQWGAWDEWTQCSATCSSSFRSRSRNLEVQPSLCGKAAEGPRDEFQVCKDLPPCIPDRNCELSDWGEWSHCSCHCFGIRERNRFITTFATGNGKSCAATALKVIEPCNPGLSAPYDADQPNGIFQLQDAPIDCLGKPSVDCVLHEWEEWSSCSKTCGGGQREKRRTVKTHPKHGGRSCQDDLTVIEPCNTQVCHQEHCEDCVWGPWDNWGGCSKCGGQRYRHRSIQQMANHCGKPCEVKAAKETTSCQSECKKSLFCAWTEWSGSTSCDACGPATTMRNRALGFSATHPGNGRFLFVGDHESECAGTQLNVSFCPNAGRSCNSCVPRHCEFGEWSEWHAPTCVGLCERERTIVVMNNECGNPCSGPLLMTKRCPVECLKPRNCEFSSWGEWSECPLLETQAQRTRSRSIVQQPDHGGNPCVGSLEETVACEYNTKQRNCQLGEWSQWNECSRTCGGEGWKERKRRIVGRAAAGGLQCQGGMVEITPCTQGPQVCPGKIKVNCMFGEWQAWTSPDRNNQIKRVRKIAQMARHGGEPCSGMLEEIQNVPPHAEDCVVSEWTEWDLCDRSCGGGQSARNRQVHRFPVGGGGACPSLLKETRGCNSGPCDAQDCTVSEWGEWGPCSSSCGAGQQSRGRSITAMRSPDGTGCELGLGETRECEGDHFCGKLDCKWGDWSEWSGCSCSCDGGQKTRTRHIARAPRNGGLPCEAGDKEQITSCNTQACDKEACRDGQWGEWDRWAPCSKTCGGGVTFRRRKVEIMANHCGKEPFGKTREIAFCQVDVPCSRPIDCRFSGWTEWSACSSSCDGIRHRSRTVATYGKGDGKWCMGALKETVPCNPGPSSSLPQGCAPSPHRDCLFSAWSGWEQCSASCGGGEHSRSRKIISPGRHGGRTCEGPLAEIKECARHSCDGPQPKDCRFGEWEDWSACGKCSGQRKRFRSILQYPSDGGKTCELTATEEAGKCPRSCSMQYCGWATWDAWGSCSASCGRGYRQRRRKLELSSNASTVLASREMIQEYSALMKRTEELDAHHMSELFTAFSAGGACLMAAFGLVRAWSRFQRPEASPFDSGAPSSRTLSRPSNFFSRSGPDGAEMQNGDYLLVAGEHETELPWAAPRRAFDDDELSS
eukprot:TRINITY_DN41956_c0_g1_i1.p1 TRINITY_DN41956_c0_g1~~TRINITY_DN41956_c0_g1_i1.p1  ORF type:complete len:1640 (-),score=239.78 TRINITY_DN41956_c0_g1_i1:105-5024(-)